jgi:hypothetical protein
MRLEPNMPENTIIHGTRYHESATRIQDVGASYLPDPSRRFQKRASRGETKPMRPSVEGLFGQKS